MSPSSQHQTMGRKWKGGFLRKRSAIKKKQAKNLKSRIDAHRQIFVRKEDENEVRAWSISESRKMSGSHGEKDTPTFTHVVKALINPPNSVVSEWVYEQGVTCTICLKEMGEVSTLVAHLEFEHKIFVQSNPTVFDFKDGNEGRKDVAKEMEKTVEFLKKSELESRVLTPILPQNSDTVERNLKLASLNHSREEGLTGCLTQLFVSADSVRPSTEKFPAQKLAIQRPNSKRNANKIVSEGVEEIVQITVKEALKPYYRESDKRWGCPETSCKADFWNWDNCVQHLKLCHPNSQILRKRQKLNPGLVEIRDESQTDTFPSSSLLGILKNPIRVEIPPKNSDSGRSTSVPTVTILGASTSGSTNFSQGKTSNLQQRNILCPLSKCGKMFPSIPSVNLHLKLHHNTGLSLKETAPNNESDEIPAGSNSESSSTTEMEGCAATVFKGEKEQGPPPFHRTNEEKTKLSSVSSGYSCQKCGYVFKLNKNLRRHLRKTSNCHLKRETSLTFAEYRIESGKFFNCPICFYKGPKRLDFVRHIFCAHPTTELVSRIESAEIKSYQKYEQKKQRCITCNNIYKSPHALQLHLKRVHKIKITLKAIIEDMRYAVEEDDKTIKSIGQRKEEATSAVNANANAEAETVMPDLLHEIAAAEIPSDLCDLQLQHVNNDDILPTISLDKGNLIFFDAVDSFENLRVKNVFEKNGDSSLDNLRNVNATLSNDESEAFLVDGSKNADTPSPLINEEVDSYNEETTVQPKADDNQYSTDDSDVELPPPGFEEEELSSAKSRSLPTNMPCKKIANRWTVTDYSFLQDFKQGKGNTFQCPLCPNVLKGCFSFCRHFILCHPKADLARQVSAKRIQGLIGMERVKCKCHICGNVVACALYLSLHFKRAHKRVISVDEVIEKPSLLALEEIIEEYKTSSENGNLQEKPPVTEAPASQEDCQKPPFIQGQKTPDNSAEKFEESDVIMITSDNGNNLPMRPSARRLCKWSAPKSYREDSPKDGKEGTGKIRRKVDNHFNSLTSTNDSKCPFCGKGKRAFSNFQQHISWHQRKIEMEKKEKKVCPICDKIFGPEKNLSKHIGWHKRRGEFIGDSEQQAEPEGESRIGNSCPICNDILPPKKNLGFHIGWHKRRGKLWKT